jgi:hypothetical protein
LVRDSDCLDRTTQGKLTRLSAIRDFDSIVGRWAGIMQSTPEMQVKSAREAARRAGDMSGFHDTTTVRLAFA